MTATSPAAVLAPFDLSDADARLVAADALLDAGFEAEATKLRTATELEAIGMLDDSVARLVGGVRHTAEVWTRERSRGEKGYDAKKAREIFLRQPSLRCVVISDLAPTRNGTRIVAKSAILYYRKSSGGRFGRSVQKVYVVPS